MVFFYRQLVFCVFFFGFFSARPECPVGVYRRIADKETKELKRSKDILQQVQDERGKEYTKNMHQMHVRVLLSKCDASSSAQWHFSSPQGFTVHAVAGKDGKAKKIIKVKDFKVTVKRGFLFYKGKRLKHAVRLRPLCGHAELNGVAYDGDFCIMQYKDNYLCINHVELEDYITAVLKTESWPGWPLEVNKALAIACRSYGAHKVLEAQKNGRPYHLKNSNAHQTYKGKHDVSVLKTAVKETDGMVLGFKNKPILAMFDSCCGGIIPAHIDDFDFIKVPYLARSYACTHCKESSLYSWQVSYDHAMLNQLLQHYKSEISWLHDVHIVKKDKAGLVMQVQLKGQKAHTIVSGKKLYSALKEVKSFHFDVHKKAGKITFSGRGFGHHLGLCQWGARQMVRDGWDYKSILKFYYPGTQFMKLS
ncbi:MAG TPA: SpoIID/LytB domain-containing protein [Candidatus Babeliales bacterium]|jgi:stage II sporulation protein D|nr:SpoIID/LytB domain-containing protein [Candidatus Babeliales bacterium]